MAETDFVAAIELGSSKITGIAGRKNSDGSVYVLACVSEDSFSFVKKGTVYNLTKTAQCLTSIINKLEEKLEATIAKVYVGIGGQSLHSIKNTVVRHFEEEIEVSDDLVDALKAENDSVPLADYEILDVVPQEYRVGSNFQVDPVGVLSNHIEGRFLNIVARTSLKKNLERCLSQAKIDVAGFYITAEATADAVLADAEKRSGCALVDLGADTTTVAVYKNNILRHLVVLPLGGNSITHDICDLDVEESEAEQLKLKHGSAVNEPGIEGEPPVMIDLSNHRTVPEQELNDIIEARVEEIVANVWNQIQISGYENQLLAGIVLTGGGANLRNIENAFRNKKKGKMERVKTVRIVLPGVKVAEPDIIRNDARFNSVLGLLLAGDENCCQPAEKPISALLDDSVMQPSSLSDEEGKMRLEEERRAEEERRKKEAEEKERKKKEKEKERKKKVADLWGRLFDDDEK